MSLTDVDWTLLPQPADDGAARHLTGKMVPDLSLMSTDGRAVSLAALSGTCVLYLYPMTGRPDRELPPNWDDIPGARGCTPQSCAYRDHFAELLASGARHVFGISSQTTEYQAEASKRLHLPFPLLSDADGALRRAMNLPSMKVAGQTLLKRLTMILRDGQVARVFYPVFPPDQDAANVLLWLQENPV